MKLTKKAGKKILPLIQSAEEKLTLYSPFISPEYAEVLVEKSESGTDVSVFTAEPDADYHRRSLQILQSGPESPKTLRNGGLALIFLAVVSAVLACSLGLLALLPALTFFLSGAYLLKRHFGQAEDWSESNGEIDVTIVEDLHAKLYSRDEGEEVVFGSANLTRSGMWRNLEVINEDCNEPSSNRKNRKARA